MTQVLIDRELLELVVKADASNGASSIALVDGWKAMAQIRAIIAQPAQQGEAVEVVAYVTTGFSGGPRSRRAFTVTKADANRQHENWVPHYQKVTTDELMTVAQHQRILASVHQQLAERDKLAEMLREARLKMAYMLKHGEWYSPEELIERIDAKLSEITQDQLDLRKGDTAWCQSCLKRRVNKGYSRCFYCS